jgi:hypothetical protein
VAGNGDVVTGQWVKSQLRRLWTIVFFALIGFASFWESGVLVVKKVEVATIEQLGCDSLYLGHSYSC